MTLMSTTKGSSSLADIDPVLKANIAESLQAGAERYRELALDAHGKMVEAKNAGLTNSAERYRLLGEGYAQNARANLARLKAMGVDSPDVNTSVDIVATS
jgi:hypothetical protein